MIMSPARSKHHRWEIYRLSWPDGSVYVGQTRAGINERLKRHRRPDPRDRVPSPVSLKFRELGEPEVEVLAVVESCQSDADTREMECLTTERIRSGGKVLNRNTIRVRQATPAPAERCYRCTWCGLWRPVAEMSLDRTRSRGVGNKCRVCYGQYSRICALVNRSVDCRNDYALAYRVARALGEMGAAYLYADDLRLLPWDRLEAVRTVQASIPILCETRYGSKGWDRRVL